MDSNYGFLINPQDLMIQRQYFQEMAEAIGFICIIQRNTG